MTDGRRVGAADVVGPAPATPAARWFLLILLAALAAPVFAHGCHGDDVDHEPAVAPPTPAGAQPGREPTR